MSTVLMVFGTAFLILFVCFLLLVLPYILHFHRHSCKYCGHSMEYKGLKEDNDNDHYLFHCPHCGAWEQISKEVFLRGFFDKVDNPLEK